MLDKLTRSLCAAECDACEGILTLEECFFAMRSMARGKTPGSNGFQWNFS